MNIKKMWFYFALRQHYIWQTVLGTMQLVGCFRGCKMCY